MGINRKRILLISSVWVYSLHTMAQSTAPGIGHQQALYVSGQHGYKSYRIPSLLTTTKGSLLAFCEGRKEGGGDSGDIDLLVRRSTDGGQTWQAQQLVWDDEKNTCGNPCPVVDESTGTIWLLMTHNSGDEHERAIIEKTSKSTRTVWVCKSDDDGLTWSEPVDITSAVKNSDWGWYATGPGIGIQVQHGPFKGRLVIPCDYSYEEKTAQGGEPGKFEYGAHVIYSDDHGQTWQPGGTIKPKVNECQVVEIADGNGTLLMNMRSYFGRHLRRQSVSYDGGIGWTQPKDVPQLVEPVCQGSILRYTWPDKKQKSCILFLNPASSTQRHNMAIRASFDEGKTWPVIKTLYTGPSAYSCMTILPNGNIGCLYEAGDRAPYEKIVLQEVTRKSLPGSSGK